MLKQLSIICGYLTLVAPNDIDIIEKEYCIAEEFNPSCASGEVIFMTHAHYGQMSLGRCLTVYRGDVGCQADVLQQFDAKCSGKQSCNVMVLDRTINAKGGCGEGLLLYLEAGYKCVKEQDLKQCEENQDNKINIDARDIYLSSSNIKNSCDNVGNELKLQVENGQTMNISVIDLDSSTLSDTVYGTLVDPANGKRVVFGNGPRFKQLLTSTSNQVHLSIQNPQKLFLFHVQVEGCQNMQPPPSAWMTRSGATVEFGCHSSAKSWSLQCENNQWIGTVGQCGENYETNDEEPHQKTIVKERDDRLSPDTALFGISSLVIFVSAVIFLIGVCVLKRKMGASVAYKTAMCGTILFPYNNIDVHGRTLNEISANHTEEENYGRNTLQGTYMNSSGVPDEASVKYFVLENK